MPDGNIIISGNVGDIAQLVVVSSVAAPTAQEKALTIDANSAWFALPGDLPLPIWPDGAVKIEPAVLPPSANAQPGQVIYAEYKGGSSWEIVARLQWPTLQAMKETYLAVLQKQPLPTGAQEFATEEQKTLPLGLGLIDWRIPDFLPNLPPAVWILLAIAAGLTAYRGKKTPTRLAAGAVAWIAAAKFVKTQKQKISL